MQLRSSKGPRPVGRQAVEAHAQEQEAPAEAGGGGSRAYDETMALEVLVATGRRSLGAAAQIVAQQVLRLHADAGWWIVDAAFEAVLRRAAGARAEGLRVAARPRGGEPFGEYRTRRAGRGGERPWRTALRGWAPLEASCDCPDFRRGSLGVCKHVLVVLADVARRKRALRRAETGAAQRASDGHRLVLQALRPLTGAGDTMAQLRLLPGRGRPPRFCRAWQEDGDGALRPREVLAADPEARLAHVQEVRRWCGRQEAAAVDPAAAGWLGEEQARLEALVRARREADRVLGALTSLRRPLYPYQREGVARFVRSARLLLADDMGLGKTVQAIAGCHALHRAGVARRGIVVVPASLRPQWQWEWESFTSVPVTLVEGRPEERRRIYEETGDGFLLVSYATLRTDVERLIAWGPEVVVLDEAQRMKNWSTRTARCVKRLDPAYRLVLTGTPLENRLAELASVMDWVHGPALEPKWRLEPAHAGPCGARHLGTLRERLAPYMLRRRRPEILSQLPPRTDSVVPVELGPEQRVLHDELERPIAQLVQAAKKRPLRPEEHTRLMSLLTRQRVVANGVAQVRFEAVFPELPREPSDGAVAALGSPKLVELRELVRRLVIEQGRKVVIFSQWRRMLRLAEWAVRDLLSEAGMRAVFFTGAEDGRKRTAGLVAFHDDPRVPILFASDAGGVGLNLQKAASCCIQLELPWNPAVFEQRVARIHRLGQTAPIDVVTLVSRDCIEERIAKLVGAKRALFEGLFDTDQDEVAYEQTGSLVERLEEMMAAPAPAARMVPEAPVPAHMVPEPVAPTAPGPAPGPAPAPGPGPGPTDAAVPRLRLVRPVPEPVEPADPPSGASSRGDAVARLFDRVRIAPRADGGLSIEAPPEAAAELRALFEGMARLLGGAG